MWSLSNNLNQYLTVLLDTIGVDIMHLNSKYLGIKELEYLDSVLASEQDFEQDFTLMTMENN